MTIHRQLTIHHSETVMYSGKDFTVHLFTGDDEEEIAIGHKIGGVNLALDSSGLKELREMLDKVQTDINQLKASKK